MYKADDIWGFEGTEFNPITVWGYGIRNADADAS